MSAFGARMAEEGNYEGSAEVQRGGGSGLQQGLM